MKRMFVIYKGIALMPMKMSRIYKFIKAGKGRIKYDRKLNIQYLQLIDKPSDYKIQEIALGIDPGSTFDGISVVSKTTHHLNIELVQRPKKGKNAISFFKKRQAMNRRTRRSRLRHRSIRFNNRTSSKLSPTIQANLEYRIWLISRLLKLVPITVARIEDVKFNHYKSAHGKSFSHVEQGKTEFYRYFDAIGIPVELFHGYDTKRLRVKLFGNDPKTSNKGEKSFEAHCLDSFILASQKDYEQILNTETGEIIIRPIDLSYRIDMNKSIIFITKIVKIRRALFRTRKNYKTKGEYFRYKKGGIVQPFENISNKSNITRVKLPTDQSNHPKKWEYIDNGRAIKYKCSTARYGGTTYKYTKFFVNNEWLNRVIE